MYYNFHLFLTSKSESILNFVISNKFRQINYARNHKRFNHRCWEIVSMSEGNIFSFKLNCRLAMNVSLPTDSNVIKFQRKFRTRTFSLQVQIASWSIPWPEIFAFTLVRTRKNIGKESLVKWKDKLFKIYCISK